MITGASSKKARNESKPKKPIDYESSSDGQEDGTSTDSEAVEEEEGSTSVNDSDETDAEEGSDGGSSAPELSSEDDDAGSSFEPSKIVHESLKAKKNLAKDQKSSSKKKYVPPEETTAQRDLRTVFVGNLSVEVAKKKPLQKQLRRHLLSAVPTAKLESIRFRSIAFHSPTDSKDGREHDKVRAATWREEQDSKEKDEKKFLTPNQKKKIAFINQEFHSTADTVHAYAVFAHSVPLPPSAPERQSSKEVKDPYEAAQIAAKHCDGTMFMDRLLRVDVVGKSSAAHTDTDPKLTIFVGNLDFASKEEDLRIFFEGVVSQERGGPPQVQEDEDEEEDTAKSSVKKARTWVTRVRVVRDRETQLGKGFAYVQFADRECVDEILALEEGKLKFAKRKLRVQRCKTIPGSSVSTRHLTADSGNKSTKKAKPSQSQHQNQTKKPGKQGQQAVKPATPIVIPKGNPKLGDTLAHLSKEERKKAKAADADRVARRLAKKKARMAMDVKDKDQAGEGKKRVRVRNSVKDNKSGKGKEKKDKGRSKKSLAKLSTKK
ncbi:hypothetical protein M378DRAFT_74638 [Amanita muscaria Koide BX008]|uniref:Nucleolar protein 12 n=1 Tax=Amanita muscaria (strain Koide BX008) TaxID=946122 RepID=A0A0C2TIJ2_AMAMK|nr:hypothetical protein M378DRAFT_74638 [Amanita muscaria Koide BX008]